MLNTELLKGAKGVIECLQLDTEVDKVGMGEVGGGVHCLRSLRYW